MAGSREVFRSSLVGQLTQITSSLSDATHPATLFSAVNYNAFGEPNSYLNTTIFGTSNGYHNGSLFLQVHINGQGGGQLSGSGSLLNVQGHIDVFNPAAGYGLGLVLHTVWDLGVGSIFFRHSSTLDPGC